MQFFRVLGEATGASPNRNQDYETNEERSLNPRIKGEDRGLFVKMPLR